MCEESHGRKRIRGTIRRKSQIKSTRLTDGTWNKRCSALVSSLTWFSASLWGGESKNGYLPSFKMTMRTDECQTIVPWLLKRNSLNLAPSPQRYWKVNRNVHLRRAWKHVAGQEIKCFKTRGSRTGHKTLQQVQKKANRAKCQVKSAF